MGVSQEAIRRWANVAPVEQDEAWPPFEPLKPGIRVYPVFRWDEEQRPKWVWRQVVRFAFWWDGTWLCPQRLHFQGVGSSESTARAACEDETYCSLPATVDSFLPRHSVNVKGVRFPKRWLHSMPWSRPQEVDELKVVEGSKLKALYDLLEVTEAAVRGGP